MPLSLDTCSTQCSPVHQVQKHSASNRDTHLCSPHISSSNNNIRTKHCAWADHQWKMEWLDNLTWLHTFIPDTSTYPPRLILPRTAWVRFSHLCSFLHKWGIASSAACECGAQEQIVEPVVLQCQICRPPHGLYDLMVLDGETIKCLLNTWPEI